MGATISKDNIQFLKELKTHNNREWFADNKDRYHKQHENIIAFSDELLALLKQHDDIEVISGKKALHRIYRDVRFAKDKSPYKTNWAGYYGRATKLLRGGYYFHLTSDACFVGGGFWQPNSQDMKLVRDAIQANEQEFRELINASKFQQHFGPVGLHGARLKTIPRGYDKNSSARDLLSLKQYLIRQEFTVSEMLENDFAARVNEAYKALRPFFNWMSDALTHDANGEPLFGKGSAH
jgi:uncharacterized protein (TIGR02453 family)